MTQFNLKNTNTVKENYQNGFLPQRNDKNLFYFQSSCRSNLEKFNLSSENRRILRKTENFTYEKILLQNFDYDFKVQKEIKNWIKTLAWDFPVSSLKTIFKDHIFNYLYIWKDDQGKVVAYSICYFSDDISHIAYVFYHPDLAHGNLPIRLVLQTIINSQELGLKYCYLGRFSENSGYYKRNMPGFEYFKDNNWVTL